jgi:DNA-binding cell septation regulator SpoVG
MAKRPYMDALNQLGYLSTLILMRRFKITRETAQKILKKIAQDCSNVHFVVKGVIAIEGREPKGLLDPIGKRKRKNKFKDITKP